MARKKKSPGETTLIKGRITPSKLVGLELLDDWGALDPDTAVLVTLDALEINRLYSSDLGPLREGALAISIDGQETSISWAASRRVLKNKAKFAAQMLYFGNPRGRLAIEASIVESDERVLRALKASQQSLNTIAAIGGQLWGAGTSFAGGIKFLGAILSLVRSQVDNDVELMLHGTIGETGTARSASAALRAGRYKIFRKPRRPSENSGDDLGIQFSIKPFSTPEIDTDVVVSLRLDSIHLELKQSAIPDYRQGVDANLNRARLIFDTTFGSGKHRNAYDFDVRLKNGQAGIGDFFNAGGREVYRGPWRMGVPFVMSMAVVNDQSELEALKGVISAGGVFSKSLAGEDLEDLIAGSTRALESMRSHLLEFLPKKVSVGKISGLIAAAGALPKESLKLPNFVALEVKSKTWSKIHFNLGSTRAGKALVTLGIKRV